MKNSFTFQPGGIKQVAIGAVACLSLLIAGNAFGAFSGDSAGTFVNPVGPGGMMTTGTGTSLFTFGNGTGFNTGPSSLQYQNIAFSGAPAETAFQMGTLTYFNGTIQSGSQADSVDLSLAVTFTDPAGINQNFVYLMQLISTPNTADPNDSADYVILGTFPSTTFTSGGNTYTLTMAFDHLQGGGFIQTGNQFHVLEGSSATADLMGTVTQDLSGVVPEPSTYLAGALLLLPFGAQAVRRLRTR
jgi:hypothetical protein